jgi:hypothetical protein
MDLIRELLLKLESLPMQRGDARVVVPDGDEIAVEGYSGDEIDYHLSLIIEAGFIECPASHRAIGIMFRRLSWQGHDFLDSVRDPETWTKTKKAAAGAGGFTVDLLKDLAKGLVKKQIEEYTGVKL